MRQEIKVLQQQAVHKLVNVINLQRETTFKAPTGSGKTYMMCDLMNQIISEDVIFLVSTLSKAGLGKQNFEKFLEYSSLFPNMNSFLINSETASDEKLHIPDLFNVYVLPRDLYAEKKNLKTSGALLNFLLTMKFKGKKIYLIRDESHIATRNLDDLDDFFTKIINFSATPSFQPDVEITDKEATDSKLIKRITLYDGNDVQDAIDKFIEIKGDYINKLKINPCLIIQISNKDKAEKEWQKIKSIIDNPTLNLKWMYIVDDNAGKGSDTNDDIKKLPVSRWKDYVKRNESLIDIIVFKMVITEGWDIPRACMLFQVRDSKSKQLDEQVVGRVRRNPILLNWEKFTSDAQDLALKSWVWGIVDKKFRNFKKVQIVSNKNFEILTTRLETLEKNSNFNLNTYLKEKKDIINSTSIFSLYKNWFNISPETENLCWSEIKDYSSWIKISNHIKNIEDENMSYMKNYKKSMTIDSCAKFSDSSFFEITDKYVEIDDWVWIQSDDSNEYHFDSDAEKEWAKILKKIKMSHWGKNFYANSTIKFEYISFNKHSSYPDFVLRDGKGKVHIFEVKSLNVDPHLSIDNDEYITKINDLRECFKHASLLTKQNFYLPIQKDKDWIIYMEDGGVETILSKDMFLDMMKYT